MKKAAITVLKALIFFAGWLVLVSVNVGDPGARVQIPDPPPY